MMIPHGLQPPKPGPSLGPWSLTQATSPPWPWTPATHKSYSPSTLNLISHLRGRSAWHTSSEISPSSWFSESFRHTATKVLIIFSTCISFYLQKQRVPRGGPFLGIFSECLTNMFFSCFLRRKSSGFTHISDQRKLKLLLQKRQKLQWECPSQQQITGPPAVPFPQVHKHISLGHWQAQLGKSQLPQSGCVCLAKGWQRQHLSGRERTEALRAKQSCNRTHPYLAGEQTR